MRVALAPVPAAEKHQLRAVLNGYLVAHADQVDPDRVHGEPTDYGHFDLYWTEPERAPLWILADDARAGFVLLNAYSPSGLGVDRAVSEFYVAPEFRRAGVGSAAALAAFATRRGRWELQVFRATAPALAFWARVLAGAPVSDHAEIQRADRIIHRFLV